MEGNCCRLTLLTPAFWKFWIGQVSEKPAVLTEAVSGPVSSQYLGEAAGLRSLPWNLLDFYKTKCGKVHEKTKASRLQQL